MSQLLERAERILESARGDEQIEVYVASGVDTEVQSYQGEVEELTTATSNGFGIRILNDGAGGARVGTAWAGSLDDEAIVNALREARDNATFATEDEFVAFARPDGVSAVTLTLTDDGVASTPLDAKIAMAIELERLVRSGDTRIDRWIRRTIRTTWPKRRSPQRPGSARRTRGPAPTCPLRRSPMTVETTRPDGDSQPVAPRRNSISRRPRPTPFAAPRGCWGP